MFFDTKGTFKINKTIREPYFNMQKEHHHNAHEIYYLVSGTRKFFLNDSIYIVNKGDLIIIPKGAIHKSTYISNLTHERLYIYFSDEYLKDLIDEYGKKIISKFFLFPHITLSLEEKIYIENLFLKIQNEYIKKDLFSNTLLKIYI
ncbi:MAG: AraC family ligand binding domain-containing protein, partial [Clostridiales bacterium]